MTKALSISQWNTWWAELSVAERWMPLVLTILWWTALRALNGFGSAHLWIGVLILVLSYTGPLSRRILAFVLPLALTAIVYDSLRFYSDALRGTVHVRFPYDFDKRFFGIHTAAGVLTPNEWWQLHTNVVLDLICGFFYMTFIGLFVGLAAYFRFAAWRLKDRLDRSSEFIRESLAMMWSFFFLNVVGYSTYFWFPAAPPWYAATYGLGPVNLAAKASPAGCIRFDQILHIHYFSAFYGKSNDVFGSIPSLHVAYPLVAVYFAHRLKCGRLFAWTFYLWMCFSAVYLNHHYVIDVLWGSAYALGISAVVARLSASKAVSVSPEALVQG